MPPRVIRQSRARIAGFLAISLLFVVGGLWGVLDPSPKYGPLAGVVCLALGGAGVVVFGRSWMRPRQLILDAEGFSLSSGPAGPLRHAWTDIERFYAFSAAQGARVISFDYSEAYTPPNGWPKTQGGSLPAGWALSPGALVELLNTYRTAAH
jgi:hypothetical protein